MDPFRYMAYAVYIVVVAEVGLASSIRPMHTTSIILTYIIITFYWAVILLFNFRTCVGIICVPILCLMYPNELITIALCIDGNSRLIMMHRIASDSSSLRAWQSLFEEYNPKSKILPSQTSKYQISTRVCAIYSSSPCSKTCTEDSVKKTKT